MATLPSAGFEVKPVRWSDLGASARVELLRRPNSDPLAPLAIAVRQIIEEVRLGGDAALLANLRRELFRLRDEWHDPQHPTGATFWSRIEPI